MHQNVIVASILILLHVSSTVMCLDTLSYSKKSITDLFFLNSSFSDSSNAQEVWGNVMPGLCTLWYSHAEISGTSLRLRSTWQISM
ncbi:hypothetical protein T11_1209 [Trichinella zimbabwensis]|uniref:Secreted protein n=1 Tax=Trichinella zimbabwensis TaxID=268475 RepID=A0A0V1HHW3_9BILA|nr:hypothetical protein T11_1209 [Trichinella zimbabwensis]